MVEGWKFCLLRMGEGLECQGYLLVLVAAWADHEC